MAKVVTITNPVTGQPAQVDQLDHTAQQIDDAVEAARWSHRNLLDNWYFADPINQRGKTEYTSAGYTIDRWFSTGNITLIQSNVIKRISTDNFSGLFQYFNPVAFLGKTVTFSALAEWDGIATGTAPYITIYFGDGNYSFAVPFEPGKTLKSLTVTFPSSMPTSDLRFGVDIVSMAGTTLDIYAAKLELGTVQTLAHQDENGNWILNDPPPDKGEELRKCQRYFQRLDIRENGTRNESGTYNSELRFANQMRNEPAYTFTKIDGGFDAICNVPTTKQVIVVTYINGNNSDYWYGYVDLTADL